MVPGSHLDYIREGTELREIEGFMVTKFSDSSSHDIRVFLYENFEKEKGT